MHGLVGDVRSDAATLQHEAAELRAVGAGLRRRREVAWTSTEADRWRARLDELVRDVEARAAQLDEAAAALRRHADEVEDRLADIAAAAAARRVVEAARYAPAPGSIGWLTFRG